MVSIIKPNKSDFLKSLKESVRKWLRLVISKAFQRLENEMGVRVAITLVIERRVSTVTLHTIPR
jgi:hypothetical protein